MSDFMKSSLKGLMQRFGYDIVQYDPSEWNSILTEPPKTIIDVGCAHGTPELYNRFPEAKLFLIDPVREHVSSIKQILLDREGEYLIEAMGEREAEMVMKVDRDRLSLSSAHDRTLYTVRPGHELEERTVRQRRLDRVVEESGCQGPFGIKVDTEGMEDKVLLGAEGILDETNFVIAEVSIQRRFENSYEFVDFIDLMDELGFRIGNILSAKAGSQDGLVSYMDILFIPSDSDYDPEIF